MQKEDQASLVVKYFFDHFPTDLFLGKQLPVNKKQELANKYLTQVVEVFSVFDRLSRYEKYFSEFLAPKETGITEAEAIEYHLRNYVQEFYILRERVQKIIRELKKDIHFYKISNPDDIKNALNHLSKNIDNNFKEINDKLRREHVHEHSISDFNLTIGKFLGSILSGEIPIPKNNNLDINIIKEKYENVLNVSKEKYIKQSMHNSTGLKSGKQFFASRFGYIFAVLNQHDGDIFNMDVWL
jgi:hypothetical protein